MPFGTLHPAHAYHSVSGRIPATPRPEGRRPWCKALRPCRFRYVYSDSRIRLAVEIHSLVRFSKRTTQHRLLCRLTGRSRVGHFDRDLVCHVVLSPTDFRPYCTILCGVLFSVRSRYFFAIGLEECLVFPGDARGIFTRDIRPTLLWI